MKRIAFPLILALLGFLLFALKKMHFGNYLSGLSQLEKLNASDSLLPDKRYNSFCYIAHAGGGYQGATYLNTLEALNNSYRLGANYIEVDINYSEDSVALLSHDFVLGTSRDFISSTVRGTRFTLENLLQWIADKEIFIITDVKMRNISTLKNIATNHRNQKNKIIPQAYTIDEIDEIKKLGFKNIIYTNYVAMYPNTIIKKLASTNHLFAITMPYDVNFKLLEAFYDLHEFNTPIFTHTINDEKIAQKLRQEGCRGIYTDTILKPSN